MTNLTRLHDPKAEAAELAEKQAKTNFVNEKRSFVCAALMKAKVEYRATDNLAALEVLAVNEKVAIEYPEDLEIFVYDQPDGSNPALAANTDKELAEAKAEGIAEAEESAKAAIEDLELSVVEARDGLDLIAGILGVDNSNKFSTVKLLPELEAAATGAVTAAGEAAKASTQAKTPPVAISNGTPAPKVADKK